MFDKIWQKILSKQILVSKTVLENTDIPIDNLWTQCYETADNRLCEKLTINRFHAKMSSRLKECQRGIFY